MTDQRQFVCPVKIVSSNADWALSTVDFDGGLSQEIIIKVAYKYLYINDRELVKPQVWMMTSPPDLPEYEEPTFEEPDFTYKYSTFAVSYDQDFTLQIVVRTQSIPGNLPGRNIVFRPQVGVKGSPSGESLHNSFLPLQGYAITCLDEQQSSHALARYEINQP